MIGKLAMIVLGAGAAYGIYKYRKMTDEEKEKFASDMKDKANKLRNVAMQAEDRATDYFNEVATKGADALKEHMPKVQDFFSSLFSGKPGSQATAGATGA